MTEHNTQAGRGYLASAEFAAQLDRLGEVAARTGLNVAPGQQVIMTAPLHAVPLVRRITEHAYKAGASLVSTFYSDEQTTLARYQYGAEDTFDTAAGWLAAGMAEAFAQGLRAWPLPAPTPPCWQGRTPSTSPAPARPPPA